MHICNAQPAKKRNAEWHGKSGYRASDTDGPRRSEAAFGEQETELNHNDEERTDREGRDGTDACQIAPSISARRRLLRSVLLR